MRAVALLVALLPLAALAKPVDRVAVIVDGDPIALSEIQERAREIRARFPDRKEKAALHEATEDLVADRLFRKQVKDLNIEISDGEVQLAVDDVLKQNRFESEEQLEEVLQRTQGLTLPQYKDNLRSQLAQMKLVNLKVRSRVKIGDEDVKRRYAELSAGDDGEEELRASHVLVKLAPDAPAADVAAAKEKAEAIAKRARAGEDFGKLASELSDGPSKETGGDLGWFRRGEMTRELEQAAFAMKVGEVSEPVRTRFGLHVVKVTGRQAVKPKPLEDMDDEIRDRLYREEMERATTRYLEELKKESVIDYRMSELAQAPKDK